MNIRILLLFAAIGLLFASGCKEDDCVEGAKSLEDYAADKNLTTQELDETGLLYTIESTGSTVMPTARDSVTINYVGMYTNGDVFDQSGGVARTFLLGELIQGWQIGLPLIGEGGRIQLLIPPILAYGSNPGNGICPDADLVFEIDLIEVIRN